MSLYSDRLLEASGMTAEAFVIDMLSNGQRLVPEAAARVVAEVKAVHAHQLAEEARQSEPDWDGDEQPWAAWNGAVDLIDPEVKP